MKIRTQYKTNGNGTGQILAKGAGKQRTVNYDHALSPEQNHGSAAGTLAVALGWQGKFDANISQVTAEGGPGRFVFELT